MPVKSIFSIFVAMPLLRPSLLYLDDYIGFLTIPSFNSILSQYTLSIVASNKFSTKSVLISQQHWASPFL